MVANCEKVFATQQEAQAFIEGVSFVLERVGEIFGQGGEPIHIIGVEPYAESGWAALLWDEDAVEQAEPQKELDNELE